MNRVLLVNGENFPGLMLDGWNITNKINSVSEFSCTLINVNKSGQIIDVDIKNGYSIELYGNGNKLFAGIIKNPTVSLYAPRILQYNISASDYTEIAYRRLMAASVVNKTAGAIVRDVILPVLKEDGITAGKIVNGKTVERANFNYIYCGTAMEQLQEITGYNWWIDVDKKINFMPKEQIEAPWELTDSVPHYGFSHSLDHEQYRNVQYIQGGQRQSTQQIEFLTPVADGENRSFFSRFPVSRIIGMKIYTGDVWADVSLNDIGINGLNATGTKKWYYTYGSREITQDSNEIPLSAGQQVQLTYVGLVDILVRVDNTAEITDRKSVEGGSGKYEQLSSQKNIDTISQAERYAESEIDRYSQIADKISFSTEVDGLAAGQILMVKKQDFGINQKFLIESVTISAAGNDRVNYAISALDGISLGGWENYFGKILDSGKNEINSDEVVTILRDLNDNLDINNQITIFSQGEFTPKTTRYPNKSMYPHVGGNRTVTIYE